MLQMWLICFPLYRQVKIPKKTNQTIANEVSSPETAKLSHK